ncbi:DNA methyltransferase [Acetivibrio thermocellus]|jgi:DNA modification methylase|uniref:DNA methyltransferase n=1 Tax=Acetivibrio thermocellus TaxID=1515 RepID=UPI0010A5B06B|nr:DNA methyltransferase [Acetivibrio thermocellus]THJ78284.1 site-specific DNA-methyltransferase [Acetivibrio thermocellus]
MKGYNQQSLFDNTKEDLHAIDNINGDQYFFYYKNNKREIVPCTDKEKNIKAKKRLDEIFKENYNIPKIYIDNRDKVKLYNPKGDVEKATALILNPEDGAYDINNKLNDMTGKEWTKFSCSWFIFNALQSDLKEEREVTKDTESHPATYSPTMVSEFIRFFTKEGQNVLDPFAGIGSTLVGCKRTGRIGYGIELNPKYYEIIKKRVPEFGNNVFNDDCRNIDKLPLPKIHYSISSPPYWDVLNRSTDGFKKEREEKGLDVKYSESNKDLGNISDYQEFLREVCSVYFKMYDILEYGAYITIIVKNVKKGGKLYPLAWDMARILNDKYVLKDEKIWIQDKIGLSPYGYPHSWASNILHHYCLILRKE